MRKSRLLWWTGDSVSCVFGCFSGFWPSCKEISCRIFRVSAVLLYQFGVHPCLFFITHAFMCACTRPREIHNVMSFLFLFVDLKKYSPATVLFSATYKNPQKFLQKRVWQKLQDRKKCVPLQPLSRGRAAENDRLVKRGRLSKALHPSILPCKTARERETDKPREVLPRNFFEKNFRKNLEGKKKRLTFADAFPLKREHERKIVLWKTLDKQTKM